MDLAETIFRIGVGIGALLVGVGLLVAVVSVIPLARDVRALARDTRRLSRLAETDLPQLLELARSVAANAELLTEDLAVRLEQSRPAAEPPPGRPHDMPVQSGDAAEDQQIA
jgi:uncharacterized membrane protein YccC